VSTYGSLETFYALVHEEAFGPTNAFPTGEEAEAALREFLGDEPDWAGGMRPDNPDRSREDGAS
jgi:hypothetical protein